MNEKKWTIENIEKWLTHFKDGVFLDDFKLIEWSFMCGYLMGNLNLVL
jgi:hypothetical protein